MTSVTLKIKVIGKDQITDKQIRKGSCLINVLPVTKKGMNPYHSVCMKYFEAKIKVKHHHTTISEGFQSVLHIGSIRQTVEVVKIQDQAVMRVGDTGTVLCRFKYGVEMISVDQKVLLRDSNTKAIGFITKVFSMETPIE